MGQAGNVDGIGRAHGYYKDVRKAFWPRNSLSLAIIVQNSFSSSNSILHGEQTKSQCGSVFNLYISILNSGGHLLYTMQPFEQLSRRRNRGQFCGGLKIG